MEAEISKTHPKKHPKMSHLGTQEATKRWQQINKTSEKMSTRKTIEKIVFFQKPCKTNGFGLLLGGRCGEKGPKKEGKKIEKVMQQMSEKERKRTGKDRK